jgi:hypothetical protein
MEIVMRVPPDVLVVGDSPVKWIPEKRERPQFAAQITINIAVEVAAVHSVLVELVLGR